MIPSIPLNDTALTIFEVTAPGAVLTIKALRSVSTQHPDKQMTTCQAGARALENESLSKHLLG